MIINGYSAAYIAQIGRLMTEKQEAYNKRRALAAKQVITFIRAHKEGVTANDLKTNGLRTSCVWRLLAQGYIVGTQVREPERGRHAFHWLWKANVESPLPRRTEKD